MESIQQRLFAMQDTTYRDFQSRLIPHIPQEQIIGVRMPALRLLAKSLGNTTEADAFLHTLPHIYYDENNLHGLLIGQMDDYDRCIAEIDRFLPYVDNWATCDSLRPKCFARHRMQLQDEIKRWLASDRPYTIRFGMEMLMVHCLDTYFDAAQLAAAAAHKDHEHYYVRMMLAWYFATALAKQPAHTLPYLQENRLPVWVHNKTIQKALESDRIPQDMKTMLRTLRR